MRVMLTGATGFVGGNLLRLLLDRGYRVRCLVRPGSEQYLPCSADVEVIKGDIVHPDHIESCARGCRVVFHVAADYRLWVPDPENMYAINVEGTKNVLHAARRAGVERVVHTSSVGALGIPANGAPGNEETPVSIEDLPGAYKKSKYLAEQEALQAARDGLDVVVVNPSTPVGPGDRKPTPTGKVVVDFLNRKMPAYLNTGLNLIHVEDVAVGHLRAMEKGRTGQKYILGHENLTLQEVFAILAELSGLSPPRIRLPHRPILALAHCNEVWCRCLGLKEPRIPVDGVRMAAKKMFFDSSKAVRELDLPQTSVRTALGDAIDWFRSHGYIRP
jgi:dihydroflavonol-4-reductase